MEKQKKKGIVGHQHLFRRNEKNNDEFLRKIMNDFDVPPKAGKIKKKIANFT